MVIYLYSSTVSSRVSQLLAFLLDLLVEIGNLLLQTGNLCSIAV